MTGSTTTPRVTGKAQDEVCEQQLLAFIAQHNVKAEHLRFTQSCHSVAEAALAANGTPQDFIKSICMLTTTGQLVVAIVKGEDRASTTRVKAALGGLDVRLATPAEMLALSGYPAGGTPPFGYPGTFFVDERVLQKPFVFGGGGSEQALVKLTPDELLRANHGRVARVRK